MMMLADILNSLYLFSDKVMFLNPPAREHAINFFQEKYSLQLPDEYVEFIKYHNGFALMGDSLYGVGQEHGQKSMDRLYHVQHQEVLNPMFPNLVPFSPDGYGNHYCFDLNTLEDGSCKIVFWQHDVDYTHEAPEVTNDSFYSWIQEVIIDWTFENYGFDGRKRG
ncbi:SMI1/KNR4 family protein [Flavihumibacter petaseus]|uniref:Knr4/Smi1-like domain-containing protein n=1 Tax=Flavihumibacter petaseus NBRC 106054 TaxID=1220578 RepID=A0A0E9N2P1_9BACT|nr:SMI1/KNR4 family protein [Flavihumibacter petaseus]GAO44068.1 hypothetical protein FPE01S_03_01080 [Flavihumibacter petaseus NBRC 106054]